MQFQKILYIFLNDFRLFIIEIVFTLNKKKISKPKKKIFNVIS
jgi:hypothetical protein